MITANFAPIEDVKKLVYDDELYDRITDDNCPPKEQFEMPEDGYKAVGGYVDGEIASLFMVHDNKMHFMVLKPFRRLSSKLWKASIRFMPCSGYCEVPALYKSLINFAKKHGFIETKIEKSAHKKNGIMYNVHTLEYEV